MISFFQSIADLIHTFVSFFVDSLDSLYNIYRWIGVSIGYIIACLSFLPTFIRAPLLGILTIILAKLVLSLGRQ